MTAVCVAGATKADVALYRLRRLVGGLTPQFSEDICRQLLDCTATLDVVDDQAVLSKLDLKGKAAILSFLSKGVGSAVDSSAILPLAQRLLDCILHEFQD
eukprot:gene26806-33783_t